MKKNNRVFIIELKCFILMMVVFLVFLGVAIFSVQKCYSVDLNKNPLYDKGATMKVFWLGNWR